MSAEMIVALDGLVQTVGYERVLRTGLLVVALWFGWKIYQDWRKERSEKTALNEKEASIQRLAQDNREWRYFFFTHYKRMTEEEKDRLGMLTTPADPILAEPNVVRPPSRKQGKE